MWANELPKMPQGCFPQEKTRTPLSILSGEVCCSVSGVLRMAEVMQADVMVARGPAWTDNMISPENGWPQSKH